MTEWPKRLTDDVKTMDFETAKRMLFDKSSKGQEKEEMSEAFKREVDERYRRGEVFIRLLSEKCKSKEEINIWIKEYVKGTK